MTISLLCKGPSIQDIDYHSINKSDVISWANLHNPYSKKFNIPNRLDILFIRNKKFIDDLDDKYKQYLIDINIKEILCVQKRVHSLLTYKVKDYLSNEVPYGFDASTGLIALNYISKLEYNKIIVAGLDLFEPNKDLYYFDVSDNLTSIDNRNNLNNFIENNTIKKELYHHPMDLHIEYIDKIIKENSNKVFEFYSRNDDLISKIKLNKNVIIK